LGVINELGHFKWLRRDYVAVANASRNDEAAHVIDLDPMSEPLVFSVCFWWKITIATHNDELRNTVVKG
jgi:hypothetical protein